MNDSFAPLPFCSRKDVSMKIWLVGERRDAPAATSRTKGIHLPLHGSFFTIVILNINTICHQRGAGLNKTILCFAIGCVHAHTHTIQKAKKKREKKRIAPGLKGRWTFVLV